ncbi:MAG: hypothetical protein GY787_24660 [Alteromonadales bacterium]|nr:hypothetical protein [Alteromonadales bacterium]
MNKEYYNKFATGLIDGLLIRLDQDYSMLDTIEGETRNQTKKVRIRNGSILERNVWIGEKNGHVMKTPEQSVHEWLCKLNMIPSTSQEIDYDKEYPSPFKDNVTKALLVLRWITGLQAMNRQNAVDITKEDLKEIGLEHMSVMDWKILFDKSFKPVVSHYHEGTWTVKIGSRDAVPGSGPGTIKIKVSQFSGLYNNIVKHHQRVLEDLKKQPVTNEEA